MLGYPADDASMGSIPLANSTGRVDLDQTMRGPTGL
jgi:hypothetical protein